MLNRRILLAFRRQNSRPQSSFFTTNSSNKNENLYENPTTKILQNALNHIQKEGWTTNSLASGARDLGYPSVAHGMFPRGPVELVEYFMSNANAKMSETLAAKVDELEQMSVTDRLKYGIKTRLMLISPYLKTWPQAMALGALPQNAPETMKSLGLMSDEIWYYAGDRSTDISWYTKRVVLTGIYASTELFMLTDSSENYEETWKFLDRRVEDAISLGDVPQNASDIAGMVGLGMKSIFSATASLAMPLVSHSLKKAQNDMANLSSVLPETPLTSSFNAAPTANDIDEIQKNIDETFGSFDEKQDKENCSAEK